MKTILPLVFLLLLGIAIIPTIASEQAETLNQKLVDTARDVIIEGVKFGLDEAGGRVLGPTAWKGFKLILSPVIKRLQKQFPALSFGKPNDKNAEKIALEAAEYLRKNKELQSLLLENFSKLGVGQKEILAGISRLERLTAETSKDVTYGVKISQEILAELRKQGNETAHEGLPTHIDVSDMVDQIALSMRVNARNKGEELNMNNAAARLVLYTLGYVFFKNKVLEEGLTMKVYKSMIGGTEHTMYTTTGKYIDEENFLCRKGTNDQPVLDQPNKRIRRTAVYCQEDGHWIIKDTLEEVIYEIE